MRELVMGEEIFQGEDKRSRKVGQGCRKRDAGQRMVGMMEIGKTMMVEVDCEVRGGEEGMAAQRSSGGGSSGGLRRHSGGGGKAARR